MLTEQRNRPIQLRATSKDLPSLTVLRCDAAFQQPSIQVVFGFFWTPPVCVSGFRFKFSIIDLESLS